MIKTVGIRDSYTFYRQFYKEGIPNTDYRGGLPIYLNIVYGLMKFMMKKVFDGYDVRLGAKLGIIGIRGRKVAPIIDEEGNIKGIAPDWGSTRKLQASNPEAKEKKTIVYCFNEHSNGIKYSFFWAKKDVIILNKSYYGLTFSRWNRRELTRLIKEENKEYLVTKRLKYERIKK